MSNQGEDGWYPECEECNCGNLNKVICLHCHNEERQKVLDEFADKLKENKCYLANKCEPCSYWIRIIDEVKAEMLEEKHEREM